MSDLWPNKDPADVLDYGISGWAAHLDLGADTIDPAQVVWSAAPSGLSLGDDSFADDKASVWISGGTAGTTYTVTCRVTTAAGRVAERSRRLFVTDR